jgi:hypothetical protein
LCASQPGSSSLQSSGREATVSGIAAPRVGTIAALREHWRPARLAPIFRVGAACTALDPNCWRRLRRRSVAELAVPGQGMSSPRR